MVVKYLSFNRKTVSNVNCFKGLKVTVTRVTRAADPLAAVTLTYLFIYDSMQQPTQAGRNFFSVNLA